MKPRYLKLRKTGELKQRAEALRGILKECRLCPFECRVNRTAGEKGRCRSGVEPMVSSCNSHFGEEPPLVGTGGSGTIFFTNCTLRCVFCQNYPISQLGNGKSVSLDELADMYLDLQRRGCHNINFVSPTHFIAEIVDALFIAIEKGFSLPLVYNTSGYELVETLELLDGIIDIYLPDMKYSDEETAEDLSGAISYVEHNRAALKEMYRQVGVLECDESGVAQRGLIIRHLVLPNDLAGTEQIIKFVANELSPEVHFGLMSQYFPAHKAPDIERIGRRVAASEYGPLIKLVNEYGLINAWSQQI